MNMGFRASSEFEHKLHTQELYELRQVIKYPLALVLICKMV